MLNLFGNCIQFEYRNIIINYIMQTTLNGGSNQGNGRPIVGGGNEDALERSVQS